MVERIDGMNTAPLNHRDLMETKHADKSAEAERLGAPGKEAENAGATGRAVAAEASISPEARQRLEAEREVMKFTRMALMEKEPPSNPRVAELRDMLDNGRINDYLRSINTDEMVDAILSGPAAASLR